MGRKSKTPAQRKAPKDRVRKPYHLHLSDAERAALDKRAAKANRNPADYLRMVILGEIQP